MPTLMLLGPRFSQVKRQHQLLGQCWKAVLEELITHDQRPSKLLPRSAQHASGMGVACFISGQRAHSAELFEARFTTDDELTIVHAISWG